MADLFSHVLQRTLSQRLIAEISDDHVSMAQLGAIRYVWLHRNVLMGDLATGLAITYPSATNMVKRLERQGLVTRNVNPVDRREVEVRLTPDGQALADRMEHERTERLSRMLDEMPEADRTALRQGLYGFIATVVGGDTSVALDVCLRCGSRAGSGCPVAAGNPDSMCR